MKDNPELDLDLPELQRRPDIQLRIAQEMLDNLEHKGLCRAVYHRLFSILLQTDSFLEDWREYE